MKTSYQASISSKIKRGLSDKGITTRSIVAFFIFGMIVLVFVLSDLGGRGKGSSSMGSAAEINGELVSLKDFQDEENRLAQYYSQLMGGSFDSEMQRNMLRNEVMNSLVTKSAISQAAEKEGIFATDAEIRHMIAEELPYFKKDGVFQSDVYKSLLQANKLTPGEFESKLRQDIKNQRSRQLFESSFGMSELQKNIETELRSSKLNLDFIQLSSAEFVKANTGSTNEKYLAFISGIEKDLAAGKSESVVAQLNAAKFNWKETGYFDIASEVIPVMNSAQGIKLAMSLTKAAPIAKKLLREGDVQFLIKLKDIKTDKGDFKIQDQSRLERQKSMGVYQAWVDSYKKSASIEVNTSLINTVK